MDPSDVASMLVPEEVEEESVHEGPEDLQTAIAGGSENGVEVAEDNIEAGVISMQDGDDFRDDQPQKMYVVGRSRMKIVKDNSRGNLDYNSVVPLDPATVYLLQRNQTIQDQREFMQRWVQGIQSSYLVAPEFKGNDHNKIQGPGRFAWDIRLMKYMDLKKKSSDINHNLTHQEAIRKLRSLHATLQKLFGSEWTRWTSAPPDTITKYQEGLATLDSEPYRDPFEIFSAEDLMVNDKWKLPRSPVTNTIPFRNEPANRTEGQIYIVSRRRQTQGQLDVVTGVLNDSFGNPIGFAGGEMDDHSIALMDDHSIAPESLPPATESITLNGLTAGSIVQTSVVPVPPASHWLSAGLSKQDTVSRIGSLGRTSRIEKEYLENTPNIDVQRTHEGLLYAVPPGHSDLEELDLQSVNWPTNSSIITMILGSPIQSLRSWQDATVQEAKTPIIIVPTAWDTLGSYSKRMSLSDMDRIRATPDLDALAMISEIFDVRPASAHIWSPTIPLWSTRHVKKLESRHEMAYELAASRANNVFHTTSTSIYGIPFVVMRKRAF